MLQRWLQTPSSYLRSQEEDYVSSLVLSAGFGLMLAGTIALALKASHDSVAHVAGIAHCGAVSLVLAIATVYYAGWGTWVRRRIRTTLRVGTLVCFASSCVPVLPGSDMHLELSSATSLAILALALRTVRLQPSSDSQDNMFRFVWPASLMLIATTFTTIYFGHTNPQELAVPVSLITLGGIAYVLPYRVWSHMTWHILALSALVAHYITVWRLT